jgi:hypothetical protein
MIASGVLFSRWHHHAGCPTGILKMVTVFFTDIPQIPDEFGAIIAPSGPLGQRRIALARAGGMDLSQDFL